MTALSRTRVCAVLHSVLALFLTCSPVFSQNPPAEASAQAAFFEKEVLPILKNNCIKCHGSGKVRGGLQLISREALLKGGDQGPAVSLTAPTSSRLLQALSHRDELKMPPTGKLPDKDIAILTRWVHSGVPWSPRVVLAAPAADKETARVTPEARLYWAYQPVRRPSVPVVVSPHSLGRLAESRSGDWVRNPIDGFLLARLQAKGLEPAPPADRIAWLRRVTFDLTGLPPTPAEREAFLADGRPDAYERLVDRLLDSPAYGEKWGRHWLDLVRYAETHGYERDNPKPFAWRYRDYVIDAFNTDLAYDRFLREQLAGDLLDNASRSAWTATGYYRLGLWDDEPVDRQQARYDMLDGLVSTTGQVVLGMSIGCARCHDHKKDPIPQRDYYRLLAFFQDVSDMNVNNTRFIATPEEKYARAQRVKDQKQEEEKLLGELRGQEKEFASAFSKQQPGSPGSSQIVLDAPSEKILVADSRKGSARWRYTFTKPDPAWNQASFKETGWQNGLGVFGLPSTLGINVRTHWDTPDIWLRQTFVLNEVPPSLAVDICHEDEVEVYINGQEVYHQRGRHLEYVRIKLSPKVHKTLRPGPNQLAIHCQQESNGQFVDAGLVAVRDVSPVADVIRRDGGRVWGQEKTRSYLALQKKLQDLRKQMTAPAGLEVMCVEERGRAPTHVLVRGSPAARGEQVSCGVPEVLTAPGNPERTFSPDRKRAELVDWLVQKDNPMTARVVVNRLWQHHFGRGIVPTPSDFGKLGEPPTHQELLDWMASELVAGNWQIKRLQRLIVLSSAYRMSARTNEKGMRIDPGNHLLWHFPMRRLEAEEVRDAILAVSDQLQQRVGGPSVYPPIAAEVLAGQSKPGYGWPTSPPREARRRSVYVHVKRSLQLPIMAMHDQPDTDASCPVRYTTTVPTQALGMLNGAFTNEQAQALAERIRREAADPADQVRRALLLTTCRQADNHEINKDVSFLKELETKGGLSPLDALRYYCLLQLNSNEFLYID